MRKYEKAPVSMTTRRGPVNVWPAAVRVIQFFKSGESAGTR